MGLMAGPVLGTDDSKLERALAFSRFGTRFADRSTERDFREWHIDAAAVPFTRIGMQTSIFGWLAACFVLGENVDGFYERAGPWAFGLVVPLILGSIVVTYIRRLRRIVLPLTAVTNAVSGLVATWAVLEVYGDAAAASVVVLIAYFGFVVFRLHPLMATAAVGTYAVYHQVQLTEAWRDNLIFTVQYVIGSTVATVGVLTGIVVCALVDRISRESYRRHRIIEDQRAALAELNDTLEARVNAQTQEIRRSRQRLVTAQDAERRRLERDLHDGAQQQLVALKMRLALASAVAGDSAPDLVEQLQELEREAGEAISALRNLAHGIYPPLLVSAGLVPALRQQAGRSPISVEVQPDDLPRFDPEVEANVYFCCLEALQNIGKHAAASHAWVVLEHDLAGLHFSVRDDGVGFDMASHESGHGMTNLADRVAALGGALEVRSAPGQGTEIRGTIPAQPIAAPAAAQPMAAAPTPARTEART